MREIADGKIVGNAFSEKGSAAVGSLVFSTRLLPNPAGGFRLDGEKFYSIGTLFSDYLTVTATTDHDSVATLVVPADRLLLIRDSCTFARGERGAVSAGSNTQIANQRADPVPTTR